MFIFIFHASIAYSVLVLEAVTLLTLHICVMVKRDCNKALNQIWTVYYERIYFSLFGLVACGPVVDAETTFILCILSYQFAFVTFVAVVCFPGVDKETNLIPVLPYLISVVICYSCVQSCG